MTDLPKINNKQELGIIFLIFVTCSSGIGYYSAIKDVFGFSGLNIWGIIMGIGMLTSILYAFYRANQILQIQDNATYPASHKGENDKK